MYLHDLNAQDRQVIFGVSKTQLVVGQTTNVNDDILLLQRLRLKMSLAAEFWTDWRRWM